MEKLSKMETKTQLTCMNNTTDTIEDFKKEVQESLEETENVKNLMAEHLAEIITSEIDSNIYDADYFHKAEVALAEYEFTAPPSKKDEPPTELINREPRKFKKKSKWKIFKENLKKVFL